MIVTQYYSNRKLRHSN